MIKKIFLSTLAIGLLLGCSKDGKMYSFDGAWAFRYAIENDDGVFIHEVTMIINNDNEVAWDEKYTINGMFNETEYFEGINTNLLYDNNFLLNQQQLDENKELFMDAFYSFNLLTEESSFVLFNDEIEKKFVYELYDDILLLFFDIPTTNFYPIGTYDLYYIFKKRL